MKRFFTLLTAALICCSSLVFGAEHRPSLRFNAQGEEFKRSGLVYWQQIVNPAAMDTGAVKALINVGTSATTYTFSSTEGDVVNGGVPGRARNVRITVCDIDGANNNGVSAATITVYGTNLLGDAISEAFTASDNTGGTITAGAKCFATLTSVTSTAGDDAGFRVSVGTGDKFGLHSTLTSSIQKLGSAVNGTSEAGTLTVSATDIESNGWTVGTATNGTNDYLLLYTINPFATVTTSTRGW